jgi:hypothetical protein
MSAYYKVQILTTDGILLAEIDNYRAIGYTNIVNAPGACEIVLNGGNPKIQYAEIDHQVEIYRINRPYGITEWQRDFVGFIRKIERSTKRGEDTFTITALGLNSLLDRRINAYYADTTDYTLFENAVAETVMKTIVTNNLTDSGATTGNGRLVFGGIYGFSVATDLARGYTQVAWANPYKPVLKDIQELATTYEIDFDVTKTGPDTFEFDVYFPQRGTDRTTLVTFSLENGNMTDPVYSYDVTDERNVGIAAGTGEGSSRQISIAFGPTAQDVELYSKFSEVFIDVRNSQGLSSVTDDAARNELLKTVPQEEFSFTTLQLPSCYYGNHYFLGDIVTSQYNNKTFIQKIEQVSVTYTTDNLEQIRVEMKTLYSWPTGS